MMALWPLNHLFKGIEMAEPIATSTVTVGTMIATGSLMTDLVILSDKTYLYLALVGAFVSMFGVLHELFSNRDLKTTRWRICAELCKGLVLGILAIPFWYLVLCGLGDLLVENIINKLFSIKYQITIEKSVWLMVSFAMSWYTVPIVDHLVMKVKRKSK